MDDWDPNPEYQPYRCGAATTGSLRGEFVTCWRLPGHEGRHATAVVALIEERAEVLEVREQLEYRRSENARLRARVTQQDTALAKVKAWVEGYYGHWTAMPDDLRAALDTTTEKGAADGD